MADVQPPADASTHSDAGEPGPIDGGAAEGVQTSTLNRPWLVKFVIFAVVLVAFGLWGLYDAVIAYPVRGIAHAEYAQWQYLAEAKRAGKLSATSDITDPKARYAELGSKLRDALEQAEYDWLQALSRVGHLSPEHTRIDGPNAKLDELTKKWTGMPQPLPLEGYAIPLQWGFAVVGLGLAAAVMVNIAKSAARKYTWEAATTTLTLADGRKVTPGDLADVDKTKWHKYFCTLVFVDGSTPADLDVLKYSGLEEWVLTLERIRFPERAAAEEALPEAAPEAGSPEGGATERGGEGAAGGEEPRNS